MLTDDNELKIQYYGAPDEDTIINMTNHSYFNLNGHASGNILEHELWVDADAFTDSDVQLIPTGEIVPVEGYTDLPGVQIYSANFLKEEVGKQGIVYKHRQGICFETQYYPDAINHENFPSPVCKKGEEYKTMTVYKFV